MRHRRPPPTRAELERQVRACFSRQVEVCEEFLGFAADMMEADPWRGRQIEGSNLADQVIAAESARGLKTYRASLDAALGGFGPQAAMLNRALFEAMATACWASANPKLAAERFNQHQRHNRALWSERLIASGVIDEPLTDLPGAEEQRELESLFGTWGDRLWCGLPMHKLIDAIEDQWEESARLRGFFAIAHAADNEAQHATAIALLQPVTSETPDNLHVDAGPSLQGVDQALHGALWSYGHLLRATAEYFEIDGREEIVPLFKRCESTFVRLDLDLEKSNGPNDPCPCGSGKRFKHCHGA